MAKSSSKKRAVIFAGGVGTRMWPISRKNTPKQFEKIIGEKSTLQLAFDRIEPVFGAHNIFVSTGEQYKNIVSSQLPSLEKKQIIGEPSMRDIGPAVGYVMAILAKQDPWAPVAILWSDHLMKQVDTFQEILDLGCEYVSKHHEVFLLIGQKPRFASQNLGWIESGEVIETVKDYKIHEFRSWHYRPDIERARRYFKNKKFSWNPGYFIVTPQFVLNLYQKHVPSIYEGLKKLQDSYGTSRHQKQMEEIYPKFEKVSFDNAIMEKINPDQAVVVSADLGWSDIGAWEALKEVLQKRKGESIKKGKVVLRNTKDSIVYNFTDQLVTTIDLEKMVVVVTDDVILICPQDSVPEIKKQLREFKGTDYEQYS